ncbi:SRPBCC family protein [Amycolatopsis sp. NPDC059027]|uniref:SRPBCC family protein n=1 Tax=unclassified Amycolatopsis TaxID=2618356 RepID=UPI00367230BF
MAETNADPTQVTLPSDDQILVTREFDAPRQLVYRAWTEPELVKRWWCGHYGTVTVAEIDPVAGGRWRYVIAVPESGEAGFHGEYREIVPGERIVTTEVPEAADAVTRLTTITFTEADGRTTLTYHVSAGNREERDAIIASGLEIGLREQLEVLEKVIAELR